jgi:hypothetical protein
MIKFRDNRELLRCNGGMKTECQIKRRHKADILFENTDIIYYILSIKIPLDLITAKDICSFAALIGK